MALVEVRDYHYDPDRLQRTEIDSSERAVYQLVLRLTALRVLGCR